MLKGAGHTENHCETSEHSVAGVRLPVLAPLVLGQFSRTLYAGRGQASIQPMLKPRFECLPSCSAYYVPLLTRKDSISGGAIVIGPEGRSHKPH